MVQVAIRGSDYRVKRIRIHGLLSELALSEAKESDFLYVSRKSLDRSPFPGQNFHRRVAIQKELVEFPNLNLSNKLRALLAFPKSEACKKITIGGLVSKPCRFYHTWASKLSDFPLIRSQPKIMMYIRVLELEGVHAQEDRLEFQESHMIHLRYLGLRNTNLTEFPFSGCNLQCLQTLDIRGTMIKSLPGIIWTSKTLEHLYLNSMHPPSINGLKALQTLAESLCSEWIARGLSSLTSLRHLKMKLIETSCFNEVVNSLRVLSNLMSLKLSGTKIPQEVIGATANHQQLFKLNLEGELQPNVLPAPDEFACYLTQLTFSRTSLEQDPMPTLKQLRSLRVLN